MKHGFVASLMLAVAAGALASDAVALPPPPVPAPVSEPTATPLPPTTGSAVAAALAASPGTNSASAQGPRIEFDSKVFDFGKTVSGQPVKHVYYFTNVGQQDLVLNNVQPGCGCTSAGDWTRLVKPGEWGKIPIQFNSANYNSPVTKWVTVTSNDKSQPSIALQLKGTVWKPIEFTPAVAALNLKPDAPFSTAIIRITNILDEPLWLSPPQSSNPAFGAELRTNTPGKEYLVMISNTMVLQPGSLHGEITLATSATNFLPSIKIPTWANVPPLITVTPSQISVPHPPLPTNFTSFVTVINNSTNPLTISDLGVNTTNVQASIQENQQGHYYTVTLKFQPGFEMPNYPLAFTAKTSNPQMAALKVPIIEMPRRGQPVPSPTQLKRPGSIVPMNPALPRAAAPTIAPTAAPTPASPPAPPSQ
jgi:Protein of unknown function (DUF1573)